MGGRSGDVDHYLGLPYAAPPVGRLRWAPPAPVVPWVGVRDANRFGNPCIQEVDSLPVIHERQSSPSEDCLFLNVWGPAEGSGLPVLVWFHGGAFITGSGSAEEFDGHNLAALGCVVITVNYRLGPFGFLSHPDLRAESPTGSAGNYGLLDQRAALLWVRDHVRSFGGDPRNVTIFGQSAGGISVSCHVVSPQAHGLFARAVSQSGTWFTIPHGLPEAHADPDLAAEDAERFAARLGCTRPGRIIEDLRRLPARQLLDATNGKALFCPVRDGWFLPEDPAATFAAGGLHRVPYILGYTRDEGTRFTSPDDAAALAGRMAIRPTETVAGALASPTYLYRFSQVPHTELASRFGAYHGVEVPYVFGNLPRSEGYRDDDLLLSRAMMQRWTTFARTGDPNVVGLPEWPPFTVAGRERLELCHPNP